MVEQRTLNAIVDHCEHCENCAAFARTLIQSRGIQGLSCEDLDDLDAKISSCANRSN